MSTKRKKTWYGVRTLYRVTAQGRPKSRDAHYDAGSTLIEDRILLFQATSFDDAIAQGVKEAGSYGKRRVTNIYGQRVVTRFLGACEAYDMPDPKPACGVEVFSSTESVRVAVPDSTVVARKMGSKVSEGWKARSKFVDGGLVRQILALMASNGGK